MTAVTRQNTLFVSEEWTRIYEALENVDFRAYDFDNLVRAMMNYLRNNYSSDFNDWIASSEFVTRIEILAWLSQNIAFRVDLNTRENFLATAERRDSLIRLAQNIGYKVNRVRSARGILKIQSIRTTEPITDSNGTNLQSRTITWNDPRDEDWFERFILIFNSSFATRSQFGSPINTHSTGGVRTDQYLFNSTVPTSNAYRFTASVNGVNNPFDIYNGRLDSTTGVVEEIEPNLDNVFNILYRVDGRGFGSTNSGFFLPFVQGNLTSQDEFFNDAEVLRTITLPATNVNNSDFFVQEVDATGAVVENWTSVDTAFGEGVSFNTQAGTLSNIYEIDTLVNDRVRVRFGDGTFGRIPVGQYRFWYRTANPTPTQIRPAAIQNQTLSIPYVSGGNLFTLTMTYSLEEPVNNAAQSESTFDIRTRAGKVYYTQNRMVTAQDYNNFYLKDNSIQKVKTVNRSFSGQSRYARLTDPLSLYQNVRHSAEDGRLYQDTTTVINLYSADTTILPTDTLINQTIKPILRQADKQFLYFSKYPEVIFSDSYIWRSTEEVGGSSRGNILLGGVAQTVGTQAPGQLKFVGPDGNIRLGGPKGEVALVDRIIEDGTAANGIILRDTIPDGSVVFSAFPALRNSFTQAEELDLEARLIQRLDFAISWNQSSQAWTFIATGDIDRAGDFSIANQGNTTSAGLDASWLLLFEFVPGETTDQWRITDRGEALFFESARELDFVFSNTEPTLDPETGRRVQDKISLLASNESRDSLRRRGLDALGDGACELSATTFIGDGTTTKFQTQEVPLLEERTVVIVDGVFQIINVDFTIIADTSGYIICFTTAPSNGVSIEVRTSSRFRNADISIVSFVGDGSTEEYDLFADQVQANNVMAFLDGVTQNSTLDFGIGSIGDNSSIIFNEEIPSAVRGSVFVVSGIDNDAFVKTNVIGDGSTTAYTVPAANQTSDTTLIVVDGVTQAPSTYTVAGGSSSSVITFDTAPAASVRVRVLSVADVTRTRTHQYEFAANGTQNSFTLTNTPILQTDGSGIIVTIDGVQQDGPYGNTDWTVTGNNSIFFSATPPDGTVIQVYVLSGTVGTSDRDDDSINDNLDNNRGNLNVESCVVNFLGEEVDFVPSDVIRHADGYVNKNGLQVTPIDADLDGAFDSPFVFKDLVLQDGHTDLVLWRRVQEFGFNVFDPINNDTVPKGTYGNSGSTGIAVGDAFETDSGVTSVGDIHYDIFTTTWLVADATTLTWIAATDQTAYRVRVGRDHLKFTWVHFAPEANRIDPSKSNLMNVYILTSGFDTAYRSWLESNGLPADEPIAESSEQLRIQYAEFEEFKPISDSIIYYPSRYKPLFGSQAVTDLQSTFKIIQTPGSTLSEQDLILRVLAAVDDYFDVDRWDFGDRFYFTEMVAFVHARLAPDLQSMVVVPKNNDQAFGRLFQVRAEADELFISAASPDDVEVVQFFTDEELRVGTLA